MPKQNKCSTPLTFENFWQAKLQAEQYVQHALRRFEEVCACGLAVGGVGKSTSLLHKCAENVRERTKYVCAICIFFFLVLVCMWYALDPSPDCPVHARTIYVCVNVCVCVYVCASECQ